MFGEDFYPTPRPVAHLMLKQLQNKDARTFLEPSAGKGDLAEVIRGDDRHSRRKVDCIELNPELVQVLLGKDFPVVGYDWLTYSGICYHEAVLMNPPFSDGANHLLKAWDFMHDGEIVCLLNEETIKNPCDPARRRLQAVISENNGRVEPLGNCFRQAQRTTSVQVAMVYLRKHAPKDDAADLWVRSTEERKPDDFIGPEEAMLAVRDELGNMEHFYNEANSHMLKAFEHIRKASYFMAANHACTEKEVLGLAMENINSARAAFVPQHRRNCWKSVFNKMQFHRWLDKKQREALLRDVETSANIPFTAENIRGTLENIMNERVRLFEQSVANVFDELTRYYKGNTNYTEGWKSNSDFKVNQKLVFPYGCRYDRDKSPQRYWSKFDLWYGSSAAVDIYNDLDRVLCVLDGRDFDKTWTIGRTLENYFRQLGDHVRAPFNNTCTSQFFDIKFWMKGTVHLKWKDRELWEKFNMKAAAGKKWIGRAQKGE